MRTDVKVGIALGAIVLIVAVSYYGTKKDGAIQLADSSGSIRSENQKTIAELFPQHQPSRELLGRIELARQPQAAPRR